MDVYALGTLLFELLSGSRPFARVAGSPLAIEREIFNRGVPSFASVLSDLPNDEETERAERRGIASRRLHVSIGGDLETIVQQALRLEPERRYPSVDAFKDDLKRFLNDLPISARADTLGYRIRKYIARHPIGVPAAVLSFVALVSVSSVALYHIFPVCWHLSLVCWKCCATRFCRRI